jgi:flagellar basal-body rod protein FlgG
MLAMEQRQNVTASNIANVMTPGFKGQKTIDQGFNQVLFNRMRNPFWLNRIEGPGGGVQTHETYSDLRPGALETTGNPLDVALQGPGYIAIDTADGVRYTRDGSLSIGPNGVLATVDGHPVQNAAGGDIPAQGGNVRIADDGTVLVDGAVAGQIRLVEFGEPRLLQREGNNLMRAPEEGQAGEVDAADTSLTPGAVERSNVQLAEEMVNMTLALRTYEAHQKIITTIDATAGRLIEQVGMPA